MAVRRRTMVAVAAAAMACVAPALALGNKPPRAQEAAIPRDSLRAAIEAAMVAADWRALDAAVSRLRAAARVAPRDAWTHYDFAYALHRRASALIVEEKPKDARVLLEEAVQAAARARELGAGTHALALEGAVTGQLAGASGALGAMRQGPRAFRLLDDAVAADTLDPRVALLNGISRLNAPRAFGGGPAKGEPELRRALRRFAVDLPTPPRPTWGRADAHIWLAIALEQQGKLAEARAELQRALEVAPGHRWVTDQLLPALDRRR